MGTFPPETSGPATQARPRLGLRLAPRRPQRPGSCDRLFLCGRQTRRFAPSNRPGLLVRPVMMMMRVKISLGRLKLYPATRRSGNGRWPVPQLWRAAGRHHPHPCGSGHHCRLALQSAPSLPIRAPRRSQAGDAADGTGAYVTSTWPACDQPEKQRPVGLCCELRVAATAKNRVQIPLVPLASCAHVRHPKMCTSHHTHTTHETRMLMARTASDVIGQDPEVFSLWIRTQFTANAAARRPAGSRVLMSGSTLLHALARILTGSGRIRHRRGRHARREVAVGNPDDDLARPELGGVHQ